MMPSCESLPPESFWRVLSSLFHSITATDSELLAHQTCRITYHCGASDWPFASLCSSMPTSGRLSLGCNRLSPPTLDCLQHFLLLQAHTSTPRHLFTPCQLQDWHARLGHRPRKFRRRVRWTRRAVACRSRPRSGHRCVFYLVLH